MTCFANYFIPSFHFFTTFSHSYSLHHGVIILVLSHLPSELEIFFYFCQKMTKNFFPKLKFFSAYKCNPGDYHPNRWVVGALPFISKFFNRVLMIAFSKVIHKKLKKSHIFRHVFLYSFSHILRTTSPPTLDFYTTANSEFLSSLIFYLWIFRISGDFGWEWNFENSISQPLRVFCYANHYTWKFHELTYHWYKGSEVNAEHPV